VLLTMKLLQSASTLSASGQDLQQSGRVRVRLSLCLSVCLLHSDPSSPHA